MKPSQTPFVLPSFYDPNSFQYFVTEDPHYFADRVRKKFHLTKQEEIV
jgi:hypothetical protein